MWKLKHKNFQVSVKFLFVSGKREPYLQIGTHSLSLHEMIKIKMITFSSIFKTVYSEGRDSVMVLIIELPLAIH